MLTHKSFSLLKHFSTTAAKAKKTYYQILEVTSNATMPTIKKNYLRLAKIYHPDIYKGKDKERFEKIQQAYQTLNDKAKRSKYDEDIGLRKKSNGEDYQFNKSQQTNASQADNSQKTKNPFSSESYDKKQQNIDIDAQFEKFFNEKGKTKFEQIRLNEEAQIRGMSQAERIRRHFSQTYQDQERLNKAQFQKQFDSIMNDQISQKNKLYEDNMKMRKQNQEAHSPEAIRKSKWKVYLGALAFFMVTLPVLTSLITKYKIQKEMEAILKQQWAASNQEMEQIGLRMRLKY